MKDALSYLSALGDDASDNASRSADSVTRTDLPFDAVFEDGFDDAHDAQNPAFSKVMQILNHTNCSEHTLRLKMTRYEFEAKQVDAAIDQAKELGFVNDEAYAAAFAEREICTKARSRQVARMKLLQKGVASDTIDKVLAEIDVADEDAKAKEFLTQKLEQLVSTAQNGGATNELDMQKVRQRLYGAASRRGISYDLVKQVLAEYDFPVSDD